MNKPVIVDDESMLIEHTIDINGTPAKWVCNYSSLEAYLKSNPGLSPGLFIDGPPQCPHYDLLPDDLAAFRKSMVGIYKAVSSTIVLPKPLEDNLEGIPMSKVRFKMIESLAAWAEGHEKDVVVIYARGERYKASLTTVKEYLKKYRPIFKPIKHGKIKKTIR